MKSVLCIFVPSGLGPRAALVVQRVHEQGSLTQGGGTGSFNPMCVYFGFLCLLGSYAGFFASLQSKHFSGRKDAPVRPQTSPFICQGLLGLEVRTVVPWNLDFIVLAKAYAHRRVTIGKYCSTKNVEFVRSTCDFLSQKFVSFVCFYVAYPLSQFSFGF